MLAAPAGRPRLRSRPRAGGCGTDREYAQIDRLVFGRRGVEELDRPTGAGAVRPVERDRDVTLGGGLRVVGAEVGAASDHPLARRAGDGLDGTQPAGSFAFRNRERVESLVHDLVGGNPGWAGRAAVAGFAFR